MAAKPAEPTTHLGRLLHDARTARGLTRYDIEDLTGASSEVLGRAERGQVRHLSPTLIRHVRALGVDPGAALKALELDAFGTAVEPINQERTASKKAREALDRIAARYAGGDADRLLEYVRDQAEAEGGAA